MAIMGIASILLPLFYMTGWNPYIGITLFVIFSGTIYAAAPAGLGNLIARMLPVPRVTRSCQRYRSPIKR
jgi:hypothetical protein